MQLLIKDMEVIGTDEVQDRGIARIMKILAKEEGNIFGAFSDWLCTYL